MALNHRLLPGDVIVAAYNAALAAVWAAYGAGFPYTPAIFAAHAAAAALPWLVARAPRRSWGFPAALREIYPLIFLLAFWPELDVIRSILGTHSFDQYIQSLDLAVFGVHLHAVWLPRLDRLWISEPMYFSYYAYYALIFIPPLVLAFRGRRAALRDATLRLMAAYLSCYMVYLVFPVYGPHFLGVPHQGPHTQGFFYHLVAAAQAAGDARGCAFPSSHVAGAVTIAFLAWRWFPKSVAAVLSLEALGVVFSTVYTQNHYAIDAATGVAWALGLQLVAVPFIQRRFAALGTRRAPARLPALAPALPASDSTGGIA